MGFEAEFEKWKEEFFGEYCMTKCDTTCCDMKNVSLYVNSKELAHIYGEKVEPKDFKSLGIKPDKPEGYYSIESKEFCRQFDADTCKCLSYNKRPKSCREFPFVVEKDALVIKSGCSLNRGGSEFKKLAQIASAYGKVIVKRAGK